MGLSKRAQINIWMDGIGYLAFLTLVSSGIIMKYILVPGQSRRMGDPTSIWGWTRHDWGDLHFWASVIFIGMIIVHIVLHWAWIAGIFRNLT